MSVTFPRTRRVGGDSRRGSAVPALLRTALGADEAERVMDSHNVIVEEVAAAQRRRGTKNPLKMEKQVFAARGTKLVNQARSKFQSFLTRRHSTTPRRVVRGVQPRAKVASVKQARTLRQLNDSAFLFDEEDGHNDSSGYSSDDSTASALSTSSVLSVLSNGRRVLPPRILGAELDVLDLSASEDEEEPQLTESRGAGTKKGDFLQLAVRTVTGVVDDLKNWHALPFDTVAEKCEFVATRDERLPCLLMMLTLLMGVFLLIAVGIGCAAKRTSSRQVGRRLMLSGGAVPQYGSDDVRALSVDGAASVSSAPLFQLVPMAV